MVKTTGPLFSAEALGRIARTRPISSSMRNRVRRDAEPYPEPTPPTPPPDYICTGSISPDATGNYYDAGTYGLYHYYTTSDGAWFLWAQRSLPWDPGMWYISTAIASTSNPAWHGHGILGLDPSGIYYPHAGASGNATIAAP